MGQLIDATTEQAELRRLTGREDLTFVANDPTLVSNNPLRPMPSNVTLYQVRAGGLEYTGPQADYDREQEAKRWAS